MEIDFKRELNTQQLEAVLHTEGPVLVIAGAGSGKTRTLVYRVARLVGMGVDPSSILLLTFTRKAAQEMLERAARIGGDACVQVAGGTFHSFCHRMLRRYAHLAGYPPGFTIMDQSDSQDLVHLLGRQMEFIGKGKKFPSKAALVSMFSKSVNAGIGIDQVVERHFPQFTDQLPSIGQLQQAYINYKAAHALMDYDDLLLKWLMILKDNPDVRETIADSYQYVMVDEYQDTNSTQAEMVYLMAGDRQNVMAVGDDSQSIYSFRGADFNNILEFPKMFQGTRIIKLERNYRSTQPNLDCTNAIIANARQKFTKKLVAQRKGGHPPWLYVASDESDQAKFVAARIRKHLHDGIEPEEIAVLFRAAFHSFQLETALGHTGIQFVKRGGMRLVDAAHIKDLLSLLKVMINPLDRLSITRALLLLDRLGPKSAEKIYAEMIRSDAPLEYLSRFNSRAAWVPKVREMGARLLELSRCGGELPEIVDGLLQWYRPLLEKHYTDDYPKRLQELMQLKAMSSDYDDAVEFLADLALDPPEPGDEQENQGKVVLSTMHSAKGLEWKVVFVISLAEGRFPSPMAAARTEELEEERRLFYVAATRARDHLYFCYPAFINMQGAGLMPARPSRFLQEIPDNLLEPIKGRPASSQSRGPVNTQPVGNAEGLEGPPAYRRTAEKERRGRSVERSAGAAGFRDGDRIRHSIFGKGTVSKIIDSNRVEVEFDAAGRKVLHLQYANIAKI